MFRTMLTCCLEYFHIFLPIFVLFHNAETNDIFFPGPITRVYKVEIFLSETLVLQIRFRLPSDFFSTMYLYWEQNVTKSYHGIKYSLCVADDSFRNFIAYSLGKCNCLSDL